MPDPLLGVGRQGEFDLAVERFAVGDKIAKAAHGGLVDAAGGGEVVAVEQFPLAVGADFQDFSRGRVGRGQARIVGRQLAHPRGMVPDPMVEFVDLGFGRTAVAAEMA